ncbi:MAG: hypothetical protein ACRD5Z_10860, partial [Bryobacteraceae bacterium]
QHRRRVAARGWPVSRAAVIHCPTTQKITPFLRFDAQAEEAALQLRNSECGLRKQRVKPQ